MERKEGGGGGGECVRGEGQKHHNHTVILEHLTILHMHLRAQGFMHIQYHAFYHT